MAYFAPPSATQRQALRRLRSSNSAGEKPAQLISESLDFRSAGNQICWILSWSVSPASLRTNEKNFREKNFAFASLRNLISSDIWSPGACFMTNFFLLIFKVFEKISCLKIKFYWFLSLRKVECSLTWVKKGFLGRKWAWEKRTVNLSQKNCVSGLKLKICVSANI